MVAISTKKVEQDVNANTVLLVMSEKIDVA